MSLFLCIHASHSIINTPLSHKKSSWPSMFSNMGFHIVLVGVDLRPTTTSLFTLVLLYCNWSPSLRNQSWPPFSKKENHTKSLNCNLFIHIWSPSSLDAWKCLCPPPPYHGSRRSHTLLSSGIMTHRVATFQASPRFWPDFLNFLGKKDYWIIFSTAGALVVITV